MRFRSNVMRRRLETPRLAETARAPLRRSAGAWPRALVAVGWCVLGSAAALAQQPDPPRSQNPSPMVEHTRAHERIVERALPGLRDSVLDVTPAPVAVYLPERRESASPLRLLIHFHGAAFVAEHAVYAARADYALAVVNLGAGSAAYERAFSEASRFDDLLAAIRARLAAHTHREVHHLELSAFSAGHGAIRAILREPRHFAAVDAVLLLDGLHTAYDPPRTVLAEGGRLRSDQLEPFLRFARAALAGEKRLLVTHSTIFPGTFASTTETTDHLVQELGLKRTPVLEWGPVGMQQLSRVEHGGLAILGFAGNSAPDHVDHLHAMYRFLRLLEAERP